MSFLQNAGTAAMQVAILYVLAAVGFACDKAGIYTEKAAKLTNDLLFYIVTPAVVVQAFAAMERTDTTLRNLLFALLGGTALHGIAILLSLPFFRRGDKTNADIFRFACIYGNVGYMALPLANAVLGETGVFFCSGVLVPFNLFVFTHGVRLMSGSAGRSVFRPLRLLLNPGVISVLLGLPVFLFQIDLPTVLSEPVGLLAQLNTPLAMLMFGTYLAHTDPRHMFSRPQTYLAALLKLIILPAVMLLLLRLCGISGVLLTALLISASAPTANNTVMFAAKYGRDLETASQTVAVVSLFSIVTMPVFIALAQA